MFFPSFLWKHSRLSSGMPRTTLKVSLKLCVLSTWPQESKMMAPFLSPIILNPQAQVNISVAFELKVQFHSEANLHLLEVKSTIIVIVVQKMECCSPPIRLWRDTVTGIWITCNQYITTACQYWWCLSMSPMLPALFHRLGCPLLCSHSNMNHWTFEGLLAFFIFCYETSPCTNEHLPLTCYRLLLSLYSSACLL